jgi:glyoxylase-like metal-dependent hydrolase (beta-lactamase superfamily II)
MERLSDHVVLVRGSNIGPMTLSGTNTYLVGTPAWVIDPGPPDRAHADAVLEAVTGLGGVAGVILTHRHFDHAGAVALLRDRIDAEVLAGPQTEAPNRFGEPEAEELGELRIVREGDRPGPFQVFETPGHAADHIALLTAEGDLFCGDTVLGEGSVFVPPGGGSLGRYLDSLHRLRDLDARVLYPGHGAVVTDPRAKLDQYISHRLERERRVIEALDDGLRTRDELLDRVWDDAPPQLRAAAGMTLESHLDKLERDGRLPDGVERMPAR